ncbi:MAG: rod shape-determining protein MreC [Gammaproteobacteria bacterium]|nr:rod shape-determining protein MreC [Rhodocyclaceae bacterium]MBU3908006.1 rod shape-determining protein MreC [Gammaproteobacteria bacterium]MBU3990612.1 rod shape-determining protein MreC [Gammaproteobacteria bacterium]MBU4006063.1 rod shape-determining protein MreC [Gammaproteobacteria bacterium]MBU4022064.1 rod shape-determining protein MreC [Gammaproteobacteria bacterium]
MSVAGHAPPPFFKRGPAPLARLAFFVTLALLLLVADLRFRTLEVARMAVATVLWPLQKAVLLPVEGAGEAGNYFSNLSSLQLENAELRKRQLAQANLLLRQTHLEDENRRLRALLIMQERLDAPARAAEILYAARDPFSRRIIIDHGLTHGLENGQAVIDELGVVGQITRAFPLTSEVTLLTDKNQLIPVQVARNGLRAVVAGAGSGAMELKFLPANADVLPGDTLVTSGLDGIYLPGLPVAKVISIDRNSSFSFARIECEPLAGVERHGQVLVLGKRIAPELPEEPKEPGKKPARGRKATK